MRKRSCLKRQLLLLHIVGGENGKLLNGCKKLKLAYTYLEPDFLMRECNEEIFALLYIHDHYGHNTGLQF
jgi:hypothetical protein